MNALLTGASDARGRAAGQPRAAARIADGARVRVDGGRGTAEVPEARHRDGAAAPAACG